MKTIVADVETDGLRRDYTKLHCLGIADGDDPDDEPIIYADHPGYPSINEGLDRIADADRVVMHNGLNFDWWIIDTARPGVLPYEKVYDTLVASRLGDPLRKAHSLEVLGKEIAGIKKWEFEEFDKFSDKMAAYCGQDIRVNRAIYRPIAKLVRGQREALRLELDVQYVIAQQEHHGFLLDMDKARELAGELRDQWQALKMELQAQFPPIYRPQKTKGSVVFTPKGDNAKLGYTKGCPFSRVVLQTFNPGSRPQIEYRLRTDFGWKPKKFTNSGQAQLDDAVLKDLAVLYPEVTPLADLFRVKKQLGQIADGDNAWLKMVDDKTHRVHGAVNTLGTITRRMSHFSPNLAQVDKKDLRMRECWTVPPGHKLVGVDADAGEMRMLGHYLQPFDGGTMIERVCRGKKEDGTDLHTVVQKALGLFDRDWAKRAEYAYLYGAGDMKLGLIWIDDQTRHGQPKPKKSPTAIGKWVRKTIEQAITGLDMLVPKVKKKHKKPGYIRALDGGLIYTRSEHSALNTLLQGALGVAMKKALQLFHFELARDAGFVSADGSETIGFAYAVNVHDEVQFEVEDHDNLPEIIGQMFADAIALAGERLGVRCPLIGNYDIGNNWKDTH